MSLSLHSPGTMMYGVQQPSSPNTGLGNGGSPVCAVVCQSQRNCMCIFRLSHLGVALVAPHDGVKGVGRPGEVDVGDQVVRAQVAPLLRPSIGNLDETSVHQRLQRLPDARMMCMKEQHTPSHRTNGPRYSLTGFILQMTTLSCSTSMCRMSSITTGSWLPAPSTSATAPLPGPAACMRWYRAPWVAAWPGMIHTSPLQPPNSIPSNLENSMCETAATRCKSH